MPRQTLPVQIPDLSPFARALARGLAQHQAGHGAPPGHSELLHLIAQALGHRNHQSLRAAALRHREAAALATAPQPARVPTPSAAAEPAGPPDAVEGAAGAKVAEVVEGALASAGAPSRASPPQEPPAALSALSRKTLAQFDDEGRLVRWPVKFSVQRLAMWVLWTRFESKRPYTEKEVNAILKQANAFGDHVTLRRELVNHRLLSRKSDCSEYRKLAARPDEETRTLLTAARARFRAAPGPRRAAQRPAA